MSASVGAPVSAPESAPVTAGRTSCAPAAPTPRAQDVARAARRGPIRRTRLVVGGLAAVLVLVLAARTMLGDFTITLPDLIRILWGEDIPGASYILMESKLPRAVLGMLVGAAFGAAGAVFQSTLRNPLASPDIIGVSLGASAAAVFAIVSLDADGRTVSVAAVLGAIAVAALVRWQAGTVGSSSGGHRLVLIGIGVAAALQSAVQYLFTRADEWDAQLVLRWLTGSLNSVAWPTIRLLAVLLAVLVPLLLWLARSGRIAELGPDAATGLGVGRWHSDGLLLVAVVLVALGVAAAGPIAFVAFLAGPIARSLNGGRTTLLGAALVGAVIVVGADHLAAYLIPDVNLPVGVVTGAFGAPFLLWLLATGRTTRRS
ncbi:MAG TPA: iron chelate uptake ABC transporter family permease subunit [Marmoricola sp.]|nr:iron chelate uptake ABC transporter family permease subunit [Marmoricola sp.]